MLFAVSTDCSLDKTHGSMQWGAERRLHHLPAACTQHEQAPRRVGFSLLSSAACHCSLHGSSISSTLLPKQLKQHARKNSPATLSVRISSSALTKASQETSEPAKRR
jgi:hypothetical protein